LSDDASICPHCKKGKMRERSAIFGVGIPDTGDRTELICDLCRHRIMKADFNPHVNVSDSIKEEKNP
jgi:hypothetical protein